MPADALSSPPSRRRRRTAAAVLAIATVAVAACGSSSSGGSATTAGSATNAANGATTTAGAPASTTAPATDAVDTFPVTIEHAYGTTEIPAQPKRVVSVGYNDQDPIVALDVVPVGVMPWYDDQPLGFSWTTERYGDTPPESVGGAQFLEINFEKVAALDPDLIIGVSGVPENAYKLLAAIAPTIAQPPGEGDYSSAPWQTSQRMVGKALGLTGKTEALIADVESQIADVRVAHPQFEGATAIVAQVYEGQYTVRGSDEVWSEFLVDLGFEVPSEIAPADYTEISPEKVELFGDLDALIWLANRSEVTNPVYPGLAVSREGRDVFVEALGDLSGAIGFNSAISLPVVIERLVPQLAAAIDGDPATAVPNQAE